MNRRASSAVAVVVAMLATIVTAIASSGPVQAAHPGENGRIAYIDHDGTGLFEVFSAEPDGSNVLQVTDLGLGVGNPQWSPDGERIVFDIGANSPAGCISGDLWVVNADGSGLTQITHTTDAREFDASWSPDGSQLVYTHERYFPGCNGSDMDLWVMDADGTNAVQITDEPLWRDSEPAWSPLGDRIAFVSNRENAGNMLDEIYTAAPDGTNLSRLTVQPLDDIVRNGHPSWSPDGQQIAFEHESALTAAVEIWAMDADGSNGHAVTRNTESDVHPEWSPDGTKITFTGTSPAGGNAIHIINADGSGRQALAGSGLTAWPTWQPIVSPPPDDDVVIDDCDDPALATLTTVTGDLQAIGVEDCDAISLPGLTAVGGSIQITGNTSAGVIDLGSLESVGGSVAITDNSVAAVVDLGSLSSVTGSVAINDNAAAGVVDIGALDRAGSVEVSGNRETTVIDLGSLSSVTGSVAINDNAAAGVVDIGALDRAGSVEVSGNPEATVIDLGSPDEVTGDVTIVNNGDATVVIDLGGTVTGDVVIESTGAEPMALGDGEAGGNVTLHVSHPGVSGSTAGGSTGVSVTGPIATMQVTLPEGTYERAVGFSIVRIGGDGLGAEAGVGADGSDMSVDPVEGYSFEFDVPQLGVPATLTFEIDVAGLDEPTREMLLGALAAGRATLATRGDAEGSGYQAFALCGAGESPTVDGCVLLEALDDLGQPTTGEPALVRFSSVVGHFSSWVLAVVEPDQADTTAPVIDTPDDVVAEATGAGGAAVTYATPAGVDAVDGDVTVQCAPPSGSTFALGSTGVVCSAADAAGNVGSAGFDVVVADTTAPAISVPAAITATATSPSGATVTFDATTSDGVDGAGLATCAPASGSTFALGATTVTCSATDAAGNLAAASTFVVTIQPQTSVPAAPVVSAVAGWGAATVSWEPPLSGGSSITGYRVTTAARGRTVASVNVGPTVTTHTFGGLANGVVHTFVVTALSNAGSGPGGTATAKPTVPRRHKAIDVKVACPSFVARNPNPYPVHVWWATTRGQFGETAIAAGGTTPLAPARRPTAIVVIAGLVRIQDAATGTC